jgi:hypothetical protein
MTGVRAIPGQQMGDRQCSFARHQAFATADSDTAISPHHAAVTIYFVVDELSRLLNSHGGEMESMSDRIDNDTGRQDYSIHRSLDCSDAEMKERTRSLSPN